MSITNKSIYIFTINGANSLYSDKKCAFASIGNGLDDIDASNLYNLVQSYQTTLNRAV